MGRIGVNTGAATEGVAFATKEVRENDSKKGLEPGYRGRMLASALENTNTAVADARHDYNGGTDVTAIRGYSLEDLTLNIATRATIESTHFDEVNGQAHEGAITDDSLLRVMFPEGLPSNQNVTPDLLADSINLPFGKELTEARRRDGLERTSQVEKGLDVFFDKVLGEGLSKEQRAGILDATKALSLQEYTNFLDLDFRANQLLDMLANPKLDSASKLRASILLSETVAKANEAKSTMEAVLVATKAASKQNVLQRFVAKFTNRNPIPAKPGLSWGAIQSYYSASFNNAVLESRARKPKFRQEPIPTSRSSQRSSYRSFGSPIRVPLDSTWKCTT